MTSSSCGPGFFGKLPMRGDFVARRLPPQFIKPWDAWLQLAITKSQEQLGEQWVDTYLSSPLWRFGLSPGVCGKSAWMGVLMPSVDQVGRYFPLTVALPIKNPHLASLFIAGAQWLEEVELLALTVLDDGADFAEFDSHLQQLLPSFLAPAENLSTKRDNQLLTVTIQPPEFSCKLSSLDEITNAQSHLNHWLSNHSLPGCTMWSTSGSKLVEPSFFLFEGLPDEAFSLLTGTIAKAARHNGEALISSKNSKVFDEPPLCHKRARLPGGNPKRWHSCALSDVGKVRKINEDAFLERSDIGLWVVADGMGGHHAGDVASQTAVIALNCCTKYCR